MERDAFVEAKDPIEGRHRWMVGQEDGEEATHGARIRRRAKQAVSGDHYKASGVAVYAPVANCEADFADGTFDLLRCDPSWWSPSLLLRDQRCESGRVGRARRSAKHKHPHRALPYTRMLFLR